MLSLFNNLALPSGQWLLVVGVGLVFFLVQLALSTSFGLRLRRQERAIRRLQREFELGAGTGGSGRPDPCKTPRKTTWVHWVVSHYPSEAFHLSSNFTREDALQELDTRIASDGSYLLLQRMGVMAPLLGVVLTVAGFYWLQVDDQDQSLKNILLAVTPLVAGVGTGAVLAIINQALLHTAGRRVESLRLAARNWFDSVIWDRYGADAQTSGLKAADVMEHFLRRALEDIDRLSDTLARAAEISVAIDAIPDHIRGVLERKLPVEHGSTSKGSNVPFVTQLPRKAH
jgi:hypothetical protein